MIPVETIPGMGIGGRDWRRMMDGWIQVWYIVRTFVMPQCTPPSTTIKKRETKKKKKPGVGRSCL
jgi:hypothetical protein